MTRQPQDDLTTRSLGDRLKVAQCSSTFVALDADGRATPIPKDSSRVKAMRDHDDNG